MRLVAKYKRLSPRERRLFFCAIALVLAIRVALWTLPFVLTRRLADRLRNPVGVKRELDRCLIGRVAWAVEASSRRIPRATCLTQALATQILLGRLGQTSELHLGVARSSRGQLEAHAWLETQGRVVLGGAVDGFHRYSRLKKQTG